MCLFVVSEGSRGIGMFPMGPVVEEPRAASAGGVSLIFIYAATFTFHNAPIRGEISFATYAFQIAPSDLHLGLTPEGGQPVLTGLGPLRTHDR